MSTVNPWKKFIGLLPGGSRIIGTVASVNDLAGTSTLTLRNGSQITAAGTGVQAGRKAVVRDGQITGPAPDLPQYEYEV